MFEVQTGSLARGSRRYQTFFAHISVGVRTCIRSSRVNTPCIQRNTTVTYSNRNACLYISKKKRRRFRRRRLGCTFLYWLLDLTLDENEIKMPGYLGVDVYRECLSIERTLGNVRLISFLGLVYAAFLFFSTC